MAKLNQWRITPMNKGGGEVVAMLQCYWKPPEDVAKAARAEGQKVDKAGWVTIAVGDPESLETVAQFLNDKALDLWFTGVIKEGNPELIKNRWTQLDAARWQWVRENGLCTGDAPVQYVYRREADEYVDQAMKHEKKTGEKGGRRERR